MHQKFHPITWIEISKSALQHNVAEFRRLIGNHQQIIAIIKANAYGHGESTVAKILESSVDAFAVNSLHELKELRTVTDKKAFVLGYVQRSDLAHAIQLGCIFGVFSLDELSNIEEVAKLLGIVQEVHIAIDAIFGREGIIVSELPAFLEKAKTFQSISITGTYAHFANVDAEDDLNHPRQQIDLFEQAVTIFHEAGFPNIQTHISGTAGTLRHEMKAPTTNSFVRIGAGVYGIWPSVFLKNFHKDHMSLHPVIAWKAKIASVKMVPAGSSVGYNLTYVTQHEMKIAIIPVGYHDGYDRKLSNQSEIIVRGTRAPIIGRVAMNMFMVDVSHIENILPEDEATVLGTDFISPETLAEKISSVNYELLSRINPAIPRIVVA